MNLGKSLPHVDTRISRFKIIAMELDRVLETFVTLCPASLWS